MGRQRQGRCAVSPGCELQQPGGKKPTFYSTDALRMAVMYRRDLGPEEEKKKCSERYFVQVQDYVF